MMCTYVDIVHDAGPALLLSGLKINGRYDFPTRICDKITRFGQITKCVLGVKLLSFLVSSPRHRFPATTVVTSLSRQPACCRLGVKVSNVFPIQIQRDYLDYAYRTGALTNHSPRPRPVTEVWSALRSSNLTVPVFHPCQLGTIRGVISIRQLLTDFSLTFITTCCRGPTVFSN